MDQSTRHPLQQARKRLGIKQTVLADLTGLSAPTIRRAERGESLSAYSITQICAYFSLRYDRCVEPRELGLCSQWMDENDQGCLATPQIDKLGEQKRLLEKEEHHAKAQAATANIQQEDALSSLSTEHITLLSLLGRGDKMITFDPSKRDTLQKIAAAFLAVAHSSTVETLVVSNPEPWERLLMAQRKQSGSATINTATLEHFERLLTISWQLCDENQFDTAEGILLSFLPHLLSLPRHEPRTASLTSHGLRLQSIVAHHNLKLNEKKRLCLQSVNYARLAGDTNTLVSALLEQATAYKYSTQSELRMKTLQEALYYGQQTSPLIQSRIYSLLAVALAENKRVREAVFYIGFAQEIFPDDPTKDPNAALADSNIFHLSHHSGNVSAYTHPCSQTFQAFDYYLQSPSMSASIPERIRLEIVNGKSRAAILEKDRDKYAVFLKDALAGALTLGSKKRFDEAHTIFREEVPASWRGDPEIRRIVEQYHLSRV